MDSIDSIKSCACDIINALRNEIVDLDRPENRGILEKYILPDSSGRTDNLFVRRRFLTVSLLLNFIMRHNPLSSQISLYEFFDSIGSCTLSKSALSQRRTRVDAELFVYLNRNFLRRFYTLPEARHPQWHGWHLFACDGSDIALPDTDSLAEYFGRCLYTTNTGKNDASFPMAKALMINDVLNGITLCGSLWPVATDERRMFTDIFTELMHIWPFDLSRSIGIFDRGYFSLKIFKDMDQAGMKFLIRVPLSSCVVKKFVDSGVTEAVIDWKPSNSSSLTNDPQWVKSGRKTISVRLVRVVLPDGQIEVLATNLTSDEVAAPRMKELYFMRWPVEVEYLHYKHALVIEAFSGARPICVRQDFFATILVHNMVRLITVISQEEVRCDNTHKKLDYKSNVAILVGIFYSLYIRMMVQGSVGRCIDILYETACCALTPIRKGRSFPRKRIRHKSSDRNRTRINRKRVC